MARPFSTAIRIVAGPPDLQPGAGHANADGIAARAGGAIGWDRAMEARVIDRRAGSAAVGMVAGGALGLIAGPPGALAGAAAGALAGMASGTVSVIVLRLSDGAELMIETPTRAEKRLLRLVADAVALRRRNAPPHPTGILPAALRRWGRRLME